MTEVDSLYNSRICRLCGEYNPAGYLLFNEEDPESSRLTNLINEYLPVKVKNDGKFPRWICPGCNIQVEATVDFFNLIIGGQEKIRELSRRESSDIISQDDEVTAAGEDFLFPVDHELSLKARGVEKPRRKRGRPPKPPPEALEALRRKAEEEFQEKKKAKEAEEGIGGSRRRRVKIPSRFEGAVVQGQELEKIYVAEGVIDKTEDISDSGEEGTAIIEDGRGCQIIGHLKSADGKVLSDLVVTQKTEFHRKGKVSRLKTRFMCDICSKTFSQELRFLTHRATHQNVRYECTECLENFLQKEILKEHQLATGHRGQGIVESVVEEEEAAKAATLYDLHDDLLNIPDLEEAAAASFEAADLFVATKRFSCSVCKMAFGCPQELRRHMTSSHQSFSCDICQKRFSDPALVSFHKESEHSGVRRFACSKCDKQFMLKHQLQRHQNVHQSARPFECGVCKKRFKTKPHLQYHALCHSQEKRYGCDICGQRFHYRGALKHHHHWHSGYRPFKCTYCGKSFLQSGILKEHLRVHTNERPFKCTQCQMAFKTVSTCRMHIQRHQSSSRRPWECEECGKAFTKHESYKIHVRRHRNEKVHVCEICQKGFAEQYALKKHSRTHSGEKPFSCNVCGKAFADGSNMAKHKKLHLAEADPPPPPPAPCPVLEEEEDPGTPHHQEEQEEPSIVYQILNEATGGGVDGGSQIIFVTYPRKEQQLLVDEVNPTTEILAMQNIVEDPTNGIFSGIQLEEDYRYLLADK